MEVQGNQSNSRMSPQYISVQMSFGEFVKRILILGFIVVVALTMWELRLILLLSFLAVIIAVSLDVPVRVLQRSGIRRGFAIPIVVAVTLFVLLTFFIFIGATVYNETQLLIEELPEALRGVYEDYNRLAKRVTVLPPLDLNLQDEQGEDVSALLNSETLTGGAALVTSVGSSVFSIAFNLFIVVVVAIYMLADPEAYANSLLSLIPKDKQERVLHIMVDLRQSLVSWLITQLFSMIVTASLVGFMLGVVWQIPNSLALAMIAGILTFIPNFGPFVSMIPGIIFTLSAQPTLVIPVIITYLVIQQLESSLITPLFIRYRLSIPAGALLIFQVMCTVLFGFMGLLLAVPMFMVVTVLVRDLYVDDFLDNINTSIRARETQGGETVLQVVGESHETSEIPLKHIFKGKNPFDHSVEQVLDALSGDYEEGDRRQDR